MAWYDRLLSIDRRWLYLALGIAIFIPTVWSISIPVSVSSEVQTVYKFVEGARDGERVFVAFDYDPSQMAELHPMAEVIVRQIFRQNGKVISSALSQFGPSMVDELLTRIAKEMGKTYGVDYVFLGYKPYPALTILAMGTNFRVPYPADYYGTPLDQLPLMEGVRNFSDVRGVISLAGGTGAEYWITYGNAKYGFPLALGVTGTMAADYYPYLQSGQIFGLLPGIKGAAEYEQLAGLRGGGSRGIPYQTAAHAVVLAFIVLTNIAFFAKRAAGRRAGERAR